MTNHPSAVFGELRIDFHTHILPEMDDGSSSLEESVRMLRVSAQDGVSCVVLTPHFYAEREEPARFLDRRERCFEHLCRAQIPEFPLLVPGAEIAYYGGILGMQELPQMCAGKSRCLLLEMPFCPWTERMLSEVAALSARGGYQVVLAHAERYLRFQKDEVFFRLMEQGIHFQANAGFFNDWRTRRKAFRLLKTGRIHLLGSDSHNMVYRPPNLGEACRIFHEKKQEDELYRIMNRAAYLLELSGFPEKRENEQ